MKKRALLATIALLTAAASPLAQSQMLDALKGKLGQSGTSTTAGESGTASTAGSLANSLGLSMPSLARMSHSPLNDRDWPA